MTYQKEKEFFGEWPAGKNLLTTGRILLPL
jgi:hypothetical protein